MFSMSKNGSCWGKNSNENELEYLINEKITNFDLDSVSNKPIIIKGCADEKFNKFIYSQLIQKIQGVVSSIMYGEACSSVPIFKKKWGSLVLRY